MKQYVDKAVQFVKQAYNELRKVSWLSKKEVTGSTVVILIFILLVSLFVGLIDFVLVRILGLFLGGRI